MKAIQIMLFLVIFNFMITVIGTLSIYNMGGMSGEIGPEGHEVTAESISNPSSSSLWVFGASLAASTIVGGIIGTIISIGTKQPASEGAAYGAFGGLIADVLVSSYSIIWNIVNAIPDDIAAAKIGVGVIVGLFLGITGILVILGYIQLIRGGMKTYI